MSDTEAPPAPAVAPTSPAAPPPAPTVPAPPAVDQPAAAPTEQRSSRTPRRRGMPIAPLVIAAGNTTTITATAAYQAAGTAGLVGTAAVFGAASFAAIARRRSTVRARRATTNAGRPGCRTAAPNRGRTGGGSLGSPSGRGRGRNAGSGAGAPRGRTGTGRGGAGIGAGRSGAPRTGLRSALGAGGGRKSRPGRTDAGAPSKRGPKHARDTAASSRAGSTPRTRRSLVRPALGAAGRGIAKTGRGIAATGRGLKSGGRALGRRVARPAAATARLARAAAKRTEGARLAARRTAGSAWDGLLSGVAGLASALWHKSPRTGLATLRAVWSKRRRNRAAKAAAKGPAMTGPEVASSPPPIATYVRRPAFAGGTPSNTGARMTGGHHFLGPAMEMHRIASTYRPEGMMQTGRDFGALPEALEHIANAMKISTARADAEDPLDPRIIEMMQQIYGLQMKAAELARQLKPAFLSCHRVDIDRLQNQRRGEHQWDVHSNADVTL